jgi:hypothetical protein
LYLEARAINERYMAEGRGRTISVLLNPEPVRVCLVKIYRLQHGIKMFVNPEHCFWL